MDDLRAVLRHREFRLLWSARAATSLGDRIVFIALIGLARAAAARYFLADPLAEAFGAVEVLIVGGVRRRWCRSPALVTPGVWRLQNSPRPSSGVEASA